MWMRWGVLQGAADAKLRASRICKSFTSEAAMRPCELVVRRIQTTSLKNKVLVVMFVCKRSSEVPKINSF